MRVSRFTDTRFDGMQQAFASQFHYCVGQLNIPLNKVNVHGGAIALGRTQQQRPPIFLARNLITWHPQIL